MEPRIQYATTSDGVTIAFWCTGEGMPLVHMPPAYPFTHLKAEWDIPGWLGWCEGLATNGRLVRFDSRGCGLSDRDVEDRSVEALVRDIKAVVDQLKLEQFALLGVLHSGPAAVAYAAQYPERVSHLVLWCSYSQAAEVRSPQAEAARALLDKDWGVYTETGAHILFGWSEGEARQLAGVMRECVTQAEAQAAFDAIDQFDVTRILANVRCPTLVVHRRQFPLFGSEVAKCLASLIPRSRLVLLEGASLAPWLGDAEGAVQAVGGFLLGDPLALPPVAAPAAPASVRTVLFTDLVGHTEMMSRLGDERGRDVLREHERIIREVLRVHGGTEVKTMGDGFMASFGSVTKAVDCAVALQRAFDERNRGVGAQGLAPLQVRCGLNAGEPIEEDGDLFGATVILASRIAAKAEGGEILVADTVRGLCSGKGFLFADRGEFVAKGFEEPARVYEVRWRDA